MHAVRLFAEDRVAERTVELIEQTLGDTRLAFDGVAASYDRSNAENRILCAMRARTLAAVTSRVPSGSRLLDLGCGPGGDAETLARAGYRVTAIDWSAAMAGEARQRVALAGVSDRVDVHHLGIHQIEQLAPAAFAAAYSNLGPLNCVPEIERAAGAIASRLEAGGFLVASVIGRFCPWELALFGSRGDLGRATIRFARGMVPVPLDGRTVWTRYYTPRRFARVFARAGFTQVSLRALGLLVPPPYMHAFADRHLTLTARLQFVEDLIAAWPGIRGWGDHFLIVLRKQ